MERKILNQLSSLYSPQSLTVAQNRYKKALQFHNEKFSETNPFLFTSPGRTELSGNHTDHNNGKVIAAAVDIDMICAVSRSETNIATIFSKGFDSPFIVDLDDLNKKESEIGKSEALIRGIVFEFRKRDYLFGGFNANLDSDILIGSGLSSSASFEIMIGQIFNFLFNNNTISKTELTLIAQAAENNYFEKPCGLMDQLAISVGGIVSIDFKEIGNPFIEKIDFDFNQTEYILALIDTGESHADLTVEYSSITNEMKSIAEHFGYNSCRFIEPKILYKKIPELRKIYGDRPVLRVIHFLNENERVEKQKQCLLNNNFNKFLDLVNQSGNSSYKYLQNIYSAGKINNQAASVGLSLCEKFFYDNGKGACRIHGGGFGGTIQAYVQKSMKEDFREFIEHVFGENSVKFVGLRKHGTVCLDEL